MKGTLSKYITVVAVVAVPVVLNAQVQLSNQLPRYAVQDLGTLGGTSSVAQGINKRGWVVGNSLCPATQLRMHFSSITE